MSSKMSKTGLLILTHPVHVTKSKVPLYLKEMNKTVEKSLYIHIQPSGLASPHDFAKFQILKTPFTSETRNLVKDFYKFSAEMCSRLDVRVLLGHFVNEPVDIQPYKLCQKLDIVFVDNLKLVDVDTVIKPFQFSLDQGFSGGSSAKVRFLNNVSESSEKKQKVDIDENCSDVDSMKDHGSAVDRNLEEQGLGDVVQTYDHVVLGGTFDRLHTGHKMLLTEGCLLSRKILTVGVTDKDMNKKKTLCELIEPVDIRMKAVEEFLQDVKPSLEYRVLPIYDGFGPTVTDTTMDLIVLSQETQKGGEMINKEREKKGMTRLLEYVIELVEDMCHNQYEEEKISSSSQRKRLLGTVYNPLKVGVTGTETPYIIGLTGGIASGKSAICKRLEGLGAVSVDCDKLGHKAYLKGTPGFEKVVSAFGEEIIGEDGEINRKALGAQVFADKSKLEMLNALVWPEIAGLAQTEIKKHAEAGNRVVVLEAAILLEAGWDSMAHEVWVTIIPPAEAVSRMVERNNLTEEQARQRLQSQMSNTERVQRSNVILSSLWEPEYTQSQVEKAWSLLQQRVSGKSRTSQTQSNM